MASRLRNNPPTFIDSPSRRPAWKWATSKEQTEHSNESKTIYSAPRHLGQSVSCKLAGETSRVRYAKPQLLKMQRIETSFCNRFQRCNWRSNEAHQSLLLRFWACSLLLNGSARTERRFLILADNGGAQNQGTRVETH